MDLWLLVSSSWACPRFLGAVPQRSLQPLEWFAQGRLRHPAKARVGVPEALGWESRARTWLSVRPKFALRAIFRDFRPPKGAEAQENAGLCGSQRLRRGFFGEVLTCAKPLSSPSLTVFEGEVGSPFSEIGDREGLQHKSKNNES